jgi:hypothetical protein
LSTTITNEQVEQVLTALGEDGLLNFHIAWDKNGVGYFEYTELSHDLITASKDTIQSITDYANSITVIN